MPMPPYPVLCYGPGCRAAAAFKVASIWSDGVTRELKTYSLACRACLPGLFASAVRRQAVCRLVPGESLERPGVYELRPGSRDRGLERRADLESAGPGG